MQIERYTHLQFPHNNKAISSENESAVAPTRAGLNTPQGQLSQPAAEGQQRRVESAVLKVQFQDAADLQANAASSDVYTDRRKSVAMDVAQDGGASQADDHQLAVQRNAGVFTQITLNKNGVLVAKPQPAGLPKQPDFVALAVSAMREFSDEAERQKARSIDFNAQPAELPWGKLKSLQQLAAKFNVFA